MHLCNGNQWVLIPDHFIRQGKKALVAAQEDYARQNSALMEGMPKLYEGRIDYFQPSFQALIKSQVNVKNSWQRNREENTVQKKHICSISNDLWT